MSIDSHYINEFDNPKLLSVIDYVCVCIHAYPERKKEE